MVDVEEADIGLLRPRDIDAVQQESGGRIALSVPSVLVTPRMVICRPLVRSMERFGTCSPRLAGLAMPLLRSPSPRSR
jgi:hypothetical protein